MSQVECDVLIVGAGPTGLYGAYYAGFRGLRVAVLDSLPEPGGQVMAMYPEKFLYDVAAFPRVRGRDLVNALLEQAAPYSPTYLLGESAQIYAVDEAGVVCVTTSGGREIRAGAAILTAGIGSFTPRRLPAGEGWEGRGLSFFVKSFDEYVDKDVVIVGGGDSAFDWALHLEPLARSVTLVHRRETFRAHEATVAEVRSGTTELIISSQVTEFIGNGKLEAVEITGIKSKETRVVKAQAVIAALGFLADLGPLTEWGLELHDRHILVDTTMATNLPRVFAAGDVTDYRGKVRLISVGFGEVATAVNNAAVLIDASLDLFPGHSSDQPPVAR